MTDQNKKPKTVISRPPVVCIMGHIDHGKSTLLDYIRKTNLVEKEAGGITQHVGAYEVNQKTPDGSFHKITFLDTPGHEAFQAIRSRGAVSADIAILVISAEDGVMPQTREALKCINDAGIPYIVAITKIDKPNANVEKVKQSLAESEIYLEGYGGTVPFTPVSGKTGEGVEELLDLIILLADIKELSTDSEKKAEGVVVESHLDKARGVTATILIKDGTLNVGMSISAEDSETPVRFMTNSLGEKILTACACSPVKIVGWTKMPRVGSTFHCHATKKDADKAVDDFNSRPSKAPKEKQSEAESLKLSIPIIVKADVLGTIGAIEHEIKKIKSDRVSLNIISTGVGDVGESDLKVAAGQKDSVVIGFNVAVDTRAKAIADRNETPVVTFKIIYELSEWLSELVTKRTPKMMTEEVSGKARILKVFSKDKDKQIVGGRVLEGVIGAGNDIRIIRREAEVAKGKIRELQKLKARVSEVQKDGEFGTMIQSAITIAPGDIIEAYSIVEK